jgi:CDP-diacylglycerol--serine O-phosphatidyltransferase
MGEKNAFDVNMLGMAPAFLIACFAALRLAKYNITSTEQKAYFIGMPVPATGILIGSLPLIMWYNPYGLAAYFQNKWVLYGIVALVCWLMVSRVKFIKMVPSRWNMKTSWPQLLLVICGIVGFLFLSVAVIPAVFALYLLLSLIYRQAETKPDTF